jgi:formamidopyrimidine-DNA glycosylase
MTASAEVQAVVDAARRVLHDRIPSTSTTTQSAMRELATAVGVLDDCQHPHQVFYPRANKMACGECGVWLAPVVDVQTSVL